MCHQNACIAPLAIVLVAVSNLMALSADDEMATEVGVAAVDITPGYPIRLSGYASRRSESDGVAQKIWAKAMAIGRAADGQPAVLITVENCGVPAAMAAQVADRLKADGLTRERLVVSSSHSHTAPWLSQFAPFLFREALPTEHRKHIEQYERELVEHIVAAARKALAARQPARLFRAEGKVGFAANRRVLKDGRWTGFGVQSDGPVDHRLPMIVVRHADSNKLMAVWANYACHCTTLGGDFNQITGDWVGYAMEYLESELPGATALISIGCGADANPEPRGKLEFAKQHGRDMADEIKRLLDGQLSPVSPDVNCRFREIDLPLADLPSREQWEQAAKDKATVGFHAKHFLDMLDRGEELPTSVRYPIGVWTLGDDLAIVFLGGEVVVDYAIRMNDLFDADRVWITAYSNDVPCYIPSKRVLAEGGYEADYSMIYYGKPTRFADAVEDTLVDATQKLLPPRFYSKKTQESFPPPKSPDQSLRSLRVRDGMKVELVAAEPLVADPVAFDWGPDGKLWVAEMSDYPNGKGWNAAGDPIGRAGGRIKVLQDTDGDGVYDQADLFLDNIPFPTGVKVWRDGVVVTAAPKIFFAKDTDGDGRADLQETLYRGFGEGNQQHRVNGLRWGLDNWLYLANGDSDGSIKSLRTGEVVDIRGRDLRIRPDTGEIETQSGRTQFGRCRDDWGNWFGGNNSNPMWHYVLDDHYLARNPHFAAPDVKKHVSVAPGPSPVFPRSRTLARFNDFDRANRFTSACSPMVYRDNLLGDQMLAFICEPVHNLVRCEIMQADGVTFTSQRIDPSEDNEFLASTDNWFRPTMCRSGPDGGIWIADMYRMVIEHPKWIPEASQRKLDLLAGTSRGRIYRVMPENAKRRGPPRLDQMATSDLVTALDSHDGWQRDMAQQMLLWRDDQGVADLLLRFIEDCESALGRLHAYCTLDGLQSLDSNTVRQMMEDRDPGVRRHGARIAERFVNQSDLGHDLIMLTEDKDPRVRMQAAYSLGGWTDARAGGVLAELAIADAADEYIVAAVMSSLNETNIGTALVCLASHKTPSPAAASVISRTIALAVAFGESVDIGRLIFTDSREPTVQQMKLAASVLDALAREKIPWKKLVADEQHLSAAQRLGEHARNIATNPKADIGPRVAAIGLIGRGLGEDKEGIPLLTSLLSPRQPPAVQVAAVHSISKTDVREISRILLHDWRTHSPALRSEILDLLLSRQNWTTDLLESISSGVVDAAELDARRRGQLLEHRNRVIRAAAVRVLKTTPDKNRGKVLEEYAAIVDVAGDAALGKAIFAKKCANCHRLENVGHPVGPDLAALTNRSIEAMLVAVLDPNRAVEDKYRDYIVVTSDGRQFNGMLISETSTGITLAGQDNKQTTILRNDIEEMQTAGKSLMPEGMEKDINPQNLADVIEYLQSTGRPMPAR